MKKETIWSKNYIMVLLCVMFAAFTHMAFTAIIPVHVLECGGSTALAGWMTTGLTVACVITRVLFGPLIDRLGRKKIFVLGAVLFTVNTLAYCFVDSLSGLFVLRILNGISQGIYFSVPATIIADVTPKNRLVDAMGFFGVASALTSAVAPSVGLWLYEQFGVDTFYIACTATAFVAMVFAALIKEKYKAAPDTGARTKRGISSIIELSVLAPSIAGMFIMLSNSSVMNFLLTCGMARSIAGISMFFTIYNVVVIFTRLVTGRLADQFGRRPMIALGALLTAVGTALIAAAQGMLLMGIASVLLGVGITLFNQLMQATVLQSVPGSRRGVANATYSLMQDAGTGFGAPLWGTTVDAIGYGWTYMLSAAAAVAACAVHLLHREKKA